MRSRAKLSGRGFSLVEILVVVAIISILMSMYLAAFAKVQRKAKLLVVAEGARQETIGRMADGANSVRPNSTATGPGRDACRAAYRRLLTMTSEESYFTELLYIVKNEDEFRAYWNTLINPAATAPLVFSAGGLVAQDEHNVSYTLPAMGDFMDVASKYGTFPVAWEFLSTTLAEMTGDGLTTIVLYSDGHVDRVKYPHEYPATRVVAEKSHQFYRGAT